jgi:hypothetical protein
MNRNGFRWTPKKERAAVLVAEDRISDRAIAEAAGCAVSTLELWKLDPSFQERVDKHRERLREEIRRVHIADKQFRIDGMVARHRQLLTIINERALAYIGQAPGAASGMLTRKVSLIKVYSAGDLDENGDEVDNADGDLYSAKKYREVAEFIVDKVLLSELRELEAAIAKELGQVVSKAEVTGKDGAPLMPQVDPRMAGLSDDELDRRLAELDERINGIISGA